MNWRKKGLIFSPEKLPVDDRPEWMNSHAALPFAEHLAGDIFRIYFTTRDGKNRSCGAFIDVDITRPGLIQKISEEPVLAPGPLGAFDDAGAMLSCLAGFRGTDLLYYTGWSLGVTVPFYFYVGVSRRVPGGGFSKVSDAPVLDRNAVDPYLTASPFVMEEEGRLRMWYVSCEGWQAGCGRPKHFYNVRYAESGDGIAWVRRGITCIPFKSSEEYAISRPCVRKDGDLYRMWYSFRGGSETYRIGYAESPDGIRWIRKDERAGIGVSSSGWDSEMIEYPFVFSHEGITYMLYNGNDYGRSGFGYAILEKGGSGR